MKQKIILPYAFGQLLLVCLSVAGFVTLLNASIWIHALNPQSSWFYVSIILSLLSVIPVSTYVLAFTATLLRLANKDHIAKEIRLPRLLKRFAAIFLLAPTPVVAFWIAYNLLTFETAYRMHEGNESAFRASLERLASLEEAIAGPAGAGEVFYQYGHENLERQNLSSAEWCWIKSLHKWRQSPYKNDYGPVFELDDLGELSLLEGKSDQAGKFFQDAVEISDKWSESELSTKPPTEASRYWQARWRALLGLAGMHESKGDLLGAARLYEKALSTEKQIDMLASDTATGTMAVLALIYLKLGENQLAYELKAKVLDFEQKAVGLRSSEETFPGKYSDRAKSALDSYAILLKSTGKLKESAELDRALASIQAARRRELNLPKPEQDKLVDYIISFTRRLIEIKYNFAIEDAKKSGLPANQLGNSRENGQSNSGGSDRPGRTAVGSKPVVNVRIDQLSMSNKRTKDAIPVDVSGTITHKTPERDGQAIAQRFRFKFLVKPAAQGAGEPRVAEMEDASDSLKR